MRLIWQAAGRARSLDIDHCFPWVAWPCGDLGNLLPTGRHVNQRLKRDRLVDAATLASARSRIVDWLVRDYWEADTGPIAGRFVREPASTLAVAQPPTDTQLLDEVFVGVEYRRMALLEPQGMRRGGNLNRVRPTSGSRKS